MRLLRLIVWTGTSYSVGCAKTLEAVASARDEWIASFLQGRVVYSRFSMEIICQKLQLPFGVSRGVCFRPYLSGSL